MKNILLILISVCLHVLFNEKSFASTLTLPYTLPAIISGNLYTDVLAVPSGNNWKVIYYSSDGNPYVYADLGEVLKDSQNDRNPPAHRAYFYCPDGTCSSTPTSTSTYVVTGDWSSCFSSYQASRDIKEDGAYNYSGYKCGTYSVSNQTVLRTANVSRTVTFGFPLSGVIGDRTISSGFGDTWTASECPTGVYKKHNGIDLSATEDEEVYAAHDGVVKKIFTGDHAQWADAIVVESSNGQFTTVYWHVIKYGALAVDDPVSKGQQIATVADLGGNTHFHFGIRMASFSDPESYAGALPVGNCSPYLAFPESFTDPAIISFE